MKRTLLMFLLITLVLSLNANTRAIRGTQLRTERAAQTVRIIDSQNRVMAILDQPQERLRLSEMPPAMASWTKWVDNEAELTTSVDHVDPLLTSNWGQDAPYNDSCRTETDSLAKAGCVAIAMAQVVHYWHHSTGVYNWDNMLDDYSTIQGQHATAAQKSEVAKFVRDCGAMVNSKYGVQSTTATTFDVGPALVAYMGYNQGIQMADRRCFSYAVWAEMMREELRNGRPIIYRGSSSSTGHCFVVDGFNEEGLFHVNWGWDGMSNGWFRFTSMSPNSLGTGGGMSKDGYNVGQSMLIGVAPANVLSTQPIDYLYADSLQLIRGSNDTLAIRGIRNRNAARKIAGKIAIGLYQNNTLLQMVGQSTKTYKSVSSSYKISFFDIHIEGLTAGQTYELKALFKDTISNNPQWQTIRGQMGEDVGIRLVATGNNSFTQQPIDRRGRPVLVSASHNVVAANNKATFSTVWTTDSSEWVGRVALVLWDGENYVELNTSGMDLRHGVNDTLTLLTNKISQSSGTTWLWGGYYEGGNMHWCDNKFEVQVEDKNTVTRIWPEETDRPVDSVLTAENPYLDITLHLSMGSSVGNNSMYSGNVSLGIYSDQYPDISTRYLTLDNAPFIQCLKGDTVVLHFRQDIANYLPAGNYLAMVRLKPDGNSSYSVLSNTLYRMPVTITDNLTTLPQEQGGENSRMILRDGQVIIQSGEKKYSVLGTRTE